MQMFERIFILHKSSDCESHDMLILQHWVQAKG